MVEPAENYHGAQRSLAESPRNRLYRLEVDKDYGNSMTPGRIPLPNIPCWKPQENKGMCKITRVVLLSSLTLWVSSNLLERP